MDYRAETTYAAEPQAQDLQLRPLDDFLSYVREYTRERPEVVAIACFGIGFVLGWKLKPW